MQQWGYKLMSSAVLMVLVLLSAVEPSTIDLAQGWRLRSETQQSDTSMSSFDLDDSDWTTVTAGTRWEDQSFTGMNGYAWYRRQVEVPPSWQGQRVWLALGGVNDSCEVFCNGQRINAFGDDKSISFADRPAVVDLTAAIHPGKNLIAIRVQDWGGSGGLVRLPCCLTVDPAQLPTVPHFQGIPDYETEKYRVVVEATGLGSERPDARLCVEMSGGNAPVTVEAALPRGQNSTAVELSIPGVNKGLGYKLNATLRSADGTVLGAPSATLQAAPYEMPKWPGEYADLKVLNSLVTELLNRSFSPQPVGAVPHERRNGRYGESAVFKNPRDGWVFISLEHFHLINMTGMPAARIDDNPEPFEFQFHGSSSLWEAMLYLKKGEHTLHFDYVDSGRIIVRAVPELSYCYYLANPHIAPYGPYDKRWMQRHILPHVNTLVTTGVPSDEDLKAWTRQGRRWVANAPLPGLTSEQAPAAQDVYTKWIEAPGATHPDYGGLIVDEFITASPAHFAAWGEAVGKLYADSRFAGKTFYAFCGDLHEDAHSLEFARGLMEQNGLFALERYIAEEPTLDIATGWIQQQFPETVQAWQTALPGSPERLIMVLGILCAPPESVDTMPNVDYNVLQEMQFNRIANDPACFGLYGLMEYSASYADEESLRWAYHLMRHYAIEGRRDRLSKAPYILDHVDNPDFADGLMGWTVDAAEEGSVSTASMEGLSWLQGRYPRTAQGDTYLALKRSSAKPNIVRQPVRNLEPGKTYSLKLFVVAPKELDVKQDLAFSVELNGAETIPELSFRYTYPSNYAHTLGAFSQEHPAYINYVRLVFKAGREPVELRITDWGTADTPVGTAGQELGVNFVQLQPYLMPSQN